VDLAGSERLKETGNSDKEAVRETGHINKSLFTLGQVRGGRDGQQQAATPCCDHVSQRACPMMAARAMHGFTTAGRETCCWPLDFLSVLGPSPHANYSWLHNTHHTHVMCCLGQVLAALSARSDLGVPVHIPYRDSKLTQLLWEGLRGDGRALMLACLGPLRQHAEESLNTLHFAGMALRIKSQPIMLLDPAVRHLD
jgi:hypothetical protein